MGAAATRRQRHGQGLVDTEGPVIGLVISFPESSTASRKFYIENSVLQREQARR